MPDKFVNIQELVAQARTKSGDSEHSGKNRYGHEKLWTFAIRQLGNAAMRTPKPSRQQGPSRTAFMVNPGQYMYNHAYDVTMASQFNRIPLTLKTTPRPLARKAGRAPQDQQVPVIGVQKNMTRRRNYGPQSSLSFSVKQRR
jgi:hypothetical protein